MGLLNYKEIQDQLPKYKVFTALLTQIGGNDPKLIYSGELTVGVTYLINGGDGWDFTNVGATNNNDGTYFVATGTTPNSWGTADPSNGLRYNTGAAIVTVLENTIGNIWFLFNSIGSCDINSNGLFTLNKTVALTSASGQGDDLIFICSVGNDNFMNIKTLHPTAGNVDNYGSTIEIRVYN